jgi:hypothetical protein
MVVDQARQDALALEVDDLGVGPASAMISLSDPTSRNRPSLMATALAFGLVRSSVVIRPL